MLVVKDRVLVVVVGVAFKGVVVVGVGVVVNSVLDVDVVVSKVVTGVDSVVADALV